MPYWKKEEECFANEKMDDGRPFPRQKPMAQKSYENWLADVVNPISKEYYPFTEKDGTKKEARYEITTIIRKRLSDDSEKLLTIGNLIGYTALGDERIRPIRHPEMWQKTEFNHATTVDPTNPNRLMTKTIGPKPIKEVYELDWNEENLNKLLEQKRDTHVDLVVKDAKAVEVKQATWDKTVKFFKNNTFEYLYNAEYVTEEQRKANIEMAKRQGLISSEITR
ncbi:MAG TPA: hypothetical protein VF220_02385 [Nitrososphaeraceae archaeon]